MNTPPWRHRLARFCARPEALSLAAVLLGVGLFLWRFRQVWGRPYLVNDDALQWVSPFYATGGADCPAVRYYLDLIPSGFKAIYGIATALHLDPLLFSKAVTACTFILTLALAYLLGRSLGSVLGGMLLFVLAYCCLGFFMRTAGGLPRAFGYPVVLLLALGFARPSFVAALFGCLLAFLFYPAIAPFGVGCVLFLLAVPRLVGLEAIASLSLGRRLFVAGGVLVVVALFWGAFTLGRADWGAQLGKSELSALPEMQRGGRYDPRDSLPMPSFQLLATQTIDRTFSFASHLLGSPKQPSRIISYAILAALLLPFVFFRRRETRVYLIFALLSALYFGCTVLLYPHLYLPGRAVSYLLPVLVLIAVAIVATRLVAALSSAWFSRAGVAGVAALGLVLSPAFTAGFNYDFSSYQPLFRALRQTPPGAVVAGWPSPLLDAVPLFGHRPILAGYETYQLFHKNYLDVMRARWVDNLRLLYTDDPREQGSLVKKYKVQFVLYSQSIHGRGHCRSLRLFRPYTGIARRLCTASTGALLRSTDSVWERSGYRLVRVGGWTASRP